MQPGDAIVVRTPDRRAFYGTLVEVRGTADNAQVVVRLDTGWVTSYPAHMVRLVRDEVSDGQKPVGG